MTAPRETRRDTCECDASLEHYACIMDDGARMCIECADKLLPSRGLKRPRCLTPEELWGLSGHASTLQGNPNEPNGGSAP